MIVETCAGPMKPSSGTVPSSRTSGDSRMWVIAAGVSTWLQNTLKLASPAAAACRITTRGGRRRGLEADGEEHHLAVRVLARDLQRVGGRIDHADVGAARLRLQQRQALRRRHAHRVAVGAEDEPGSRGELDARCRCGRSAARTPGSPDRGSCARWPAAGRRRRSGRSRACGRRRTPSGGSRAAGRPRARSPRPAPAPARRRGIRRCTSCHDRGALTSMPASANSRSVLSASSGSSLVSA